ncbi:MAG TPA: S24/S26 family peptidase, partial [Candidatus Synoicihabitans sp.]|nr:S24/S26 family peptidase [Candidatus Synoicihabitans sp.]
DQLAVGMMVAYRNQRGFVVVHRLVARTRQGDWRVQGLNNAALDRETVTRQNLLGVVYVSLAHEGEPPTFGPTPAPRP